MFSNISLTTIGISITFPAGAVPPSDWEEQRAHMGKTN